MPQQAISKTPMQPPSKDYEDIAHQESDHRLDSMASLLNGFNEESVEQEVKKTTRIPRNIVDRKAQIKTKILRRRPSEESLDLGKGDEKSIQVHSQREATQLEVSKYYLDITMNFLQDQVQMAESRRPHIQEELREMDPPGSDSSASEESAEM